MNAFTHTAIADELIGADIPRDVAMRAAGRIARHMSASDARALRIEAAQACWDAREAEADSDPYFGGGSAW